MNTQQRRWLRLLEAPPLGVFKQQLAFWYQQMSCNKVLRQRSGAVRVMQQNHVTMGQEISCQEGCRDAARGCHCNLSLAGKSFLKEANPVAAIEGPGQEECFSK